MTFYTIKGSIQLQNRNYFEVFRKHEQTNIINFNESNVQ